MAKMHLWILSTFLSFQLFSTIFGSNINEIDSIIAEIESSNKNENKNEKSCVVPHRNMDCDEDIVDKTVPDGTLCFFVTGEGLDVYCVEGEWKEVPANSLLSSEREKRTHSVCYTRRSRSRRGWRRRRSRRARTSCYKPNHAPYFTNCQYSLSFTTPSKQTSMKVTWTVPYATDIEDGARSVKQTDGPVNGAQLQGSPEGKVYNVYYVSGKDSRGLSAQCKLRISVKVVFCSTPSAPSFGKVDCSGTNYGHSCIFTCAYGYAPTVPSIQCQSNGQWTNGGTSECKGVICPQTTPSIPHGSYSCSHYTYGASCYPVCDPGYSVSLLYPITCKSDSQWSIPITEVCKDSEPPVLSRCPSDIVVTADKGMTSAAVTWDLPLASDNQDNTSPKVEQTAGSISPGSRVDNGIVHTVKYVAYDNAGNPSEECSFNVQVKVSRCLSTSAPQNGQYQCDKGFIYGSQCSFSCNQGHLLQGFSVLSCRQDGTWDLTPPICEVLKCLQPDHYGIMIQNGYFDCPPLIPYLSVCHPVCNSGFEIKQYSAALCTADADNNATFVVSVQPECLDSEPPIFVDCGGIKVLKFSAEKGKTTAIVHYDNPKAVDNYDSTPVVRKISGPNSGHTVDAKDIEYVEFQATDDAGNPSARCTYVLKVDVLECNAYVPPSDGEVTCTADYIYGSVCNLGCLEGYENLGPLSAECLGNGSWTVTNFECTKIICPSSPVAPENGRYICPSITYPYNTICYADCDEGFSLSEWSYARCKADKSWETSSIPVCIDSEPPVFTDCNSEVTIKAERGLERAAVNWTVPSATDNVDSIPMITKISGPEPGDRIEGEATVKYQATDQAGNPSEICTIHITVEVTRCSSPHWPEEGSITCDLGDIYGSECTYTCDEGYNVSLPSTAVCGEDGSWSYGNQPPTCSPITCGHPESVPYGKFVCFDFSYQYQSLCVLECLSGYSTDKSVYARCQSTGEWAVSASNNCKDITPPTILNCKTYQTFYADRGLDTAQVTWVVPTANDNADSRDDITIEQLSGPPAGSNISIGTTVVDYRAVDTAGNPSIVTCSITINVEAVYCNQPKYSFDDTRLEFLCTSYKWGDTCIPSCPRQASLTLKGPNKIMCEVTFSGTSPSTSWKFEGTVQPYCEAEVCPKNLSKPQNGALAYTNDGQPIVYVLCNEGFDLSYQFNGQIFCLSSGLWNPDTVPDCTRTRRPGLNLLPVEYYYYGDCSSLSTIEAIKNQILVLLQDFIGTAVAPACLTDSECGYDDLTVECGVTRKKKDIYENRKKRQASSVHVKFSLTVNGSVSNWDELLMFEENLFQISDIFKSAVTVDGTFNLNGYEVVPDSFTRAEYSENKCQGRGQVKDGFKCKSCAAGMYLAEIYEAKSCLECPVGTYMDSDSATTCISCPDGTSTNATGAKSADMCVELCPVGYSSLTAVQPCSPCPIGYYQDRIGQTACRRCEFGKTTFGIGSQNCSHYDIILNEQNSQKIAVQLNTSTVFDKISFLLWIFRSNGSQFGIRLESGFFISVLEDALITSWDGNSMNVSLPYSSLHKWTHLAVTLTSTNYSIYYNGEVLITQQNVSSVLVLANKTVKLNFSGETDIRLTSLALYNHSLSADEISSHRTSCTYDISATVFSTDDFVNGNGIFTEPSSCTAIDYCADEPCGSHMCTPTLSGFFCTCTGGFKGPICEIAPDNCNQNECQYGATCVSSSKNYTCICPPGFRGHFCQNLPKNGGWSSWSSWGVCDVNCDGGVKKRTRACDNPTPGQYGTQCVGDMSEELECNLEPCNATNPCLVNPCGEHRCLETSNGFICKCNSGYTGVLCQFQVDHCTPNPCHNEGSCENGVDNFTCICPEKFGGHLCEEAKDGPTYWTSWSQCTVTCNGGISNRTRVCAQNQTCSNQIESRLCNNVSCVVDNCQTKPCGTNQCISSAEGFTCICSTGFTGSTCNTPIDFCEQNNCENGQCNNTVSGYTCFCDEGYSGDLCNIPLHHGQWGMWTEWGDCSITCGSGERKRNRTCDNPPPSPGGKPCDGNSEEQKICTPECYDACLSNPCGIKHGCTTDGTGYKCSCKDGYSGSHCTIPPDNCLPNPCENSAECISMENGFTCSCANGYSGTTCGIEPDESVWGAWTRWDTCSASCGGGKQTRHRDCKLGSKGKNCPGTKTENRTCEEDSCLACPILSKHYGMKTRCNSTDDVTTCILTCVPGFYPPNSTYSVDSWAVIYQCGPFSSYKWNITDEKPSCSKGTGRPSHVKAQAIMPIVPEISCGKASDLEINLRRFVSNFVCKNGTNCLVSASVTKCQNRKRRQIEEEKKSEITFTFTFDFGNDTETDNNDTTEYWDTVEEALSPITTNGGDWLSVELDGVRYVADSTNVSKESSVECSNGYFLQDEYDMCVGCSPGTMYESGLGYCVSCPLGTYQQLSAQYSCIPCPDGYTTNITGSYDQYDCYYLEEVDEAIKDDSDKSMGFIIGAAVGGSTCAAFIAVLVVAVVVKTKRARMKRRIDVSAVDRSEEEFEKNNRKMLERQKTSGSIRSASNIPMTYENLD
ncbi:sushi, von Willebrand factor type A, EGF and pentraxin domain-containing protein 1-like [Mercenaria mercenaria]|uniref:sushi, von Willebrand factor type A, EGF and pentraxin domain-containing protein 1-like n=1 Tax=Mercenaria mercenaria TaxID=6596 RepID=UPI00234F8DCE|nr:sushi, von Willebrand factor type A, EGF and pentraxin domain-containing protein 1-like [Mercenaria mercenaria]